MQIILDGCLAFFAAVGVGAILLALIPTNTPEATSKMEAPLLVLLSVQGDGIQIQSLLPQLQKHIHSGNIILVDDGLDEQGRRMAAALLRNDPALRCCTRDALPHLISQTTPEAPS